MRQKTNNQTTKKTMPNTKFQQLPAYWCEDTSTYGYGDKIIFRERVKEKLDELLENVQPAVYRDANAIILEEQQQRQRWLEEHGHSEEIVIAKNQLPLSFRKKRQRK